MKIIILFMLIFYYPQYLLSQDITELKRSVAESANEICPVKIGEPIPDVTLKNIDGNSINLQEIVNQKPTLLIFYRGGWCPYCNLHLAELAEIEDNIIEMGYQIIAVSMDRPEKLKESLDKYQMNYTLLSDSKAEASIAFGLAFKVEESYNEMLKSHNLDIEDASGEDHHILPVPSVFIIKDGVIKFEYVNPNYKVRISKEILLSISTEIIRN
jgi:peroxiredoxin